MRRLAAPLLILVALSACSSSPSTHGAVTTALPGTASPSATIPESPSPVASPSVALVASPSVSPVASPSPDLPISTLDFTCRLPVVINTNEFLFTGGFISFPSGTYQADPKGVIQGSPDNVFVTTASPVLRGSSASIYDLAMKRWLPAGAGQTSPDGGSYAYMVAIPSGSEATQVHIVQVATGDDHVITLAPPPTGVGWQLEDFDGKSVFLTSQLVDQFPAGVWRLDVATGSLHQLTQAGHVLRVQSGTAWIGLVNPADPSPPTPGKGEAFDTIAAVNLSTGAQTTWVYEPGKSVEVVAVDEFGRLVASIGPPPDFAPTSVVFYQSAGSVGDVVTGGGSALFWVEPDRGQLWFGSDRGIYFWTSATGFVKVYALQGPDSGVGQSIAPAGHCV
jgi:hypothetical protein